MRTHITNTTIGDIAQYTARTANHTTTIIFGAGGPFLMWNGRPVKIDAPNRFGTTDTPAARHAFVKAYVEATISLNGSQAAR